MKQIGGHPPPAPPQPAAGPYRLGDQISTGELALNRELVPPRLVLAQVAAAHRHQAEQQGVDLTLSVSPELPDICVDPDRMAQVLSNLVSNALRHTPSGEQISLATT